MKDWRKELIMVSPENNGNGYVEYIEAIRDEMREACAEAYKNYYKNVEKIGWWHKIVAAIMNAGREKP